MGTAPGHALCAPPRPPQSDRQGARLAQSFTKGERRRCRQVEGPNRRSDWNAHPCVTVVGYSRWNACAFLAEKQDIVSPEPEFVSRLGAFRREQDQPPSRDGPPERVEVGMTYDIDMVDIVHGGPPHPSIVPLEPHRLDKIDGRSQAGAKPQDGADVLGNLGLEQRNPHAVGLAQAISNVRIQGRRRRKSLMSAMGGKRTLAMAIFAP